jgi:hypothetical protein
MVKASVLKEHGWRKIKSDKQAYQITRWLIKFLRKEEARRKNKLGGVSLYDFELLLNIKPGVWFKLFRVDRDGITSKTVLIWSGKVSDE